MATRAGQREQSMVRPTTPQHVLLGACLTSSAGALLFNVMPAFLAAAARSFDLGDAALGWLGSTYLAGFALAAIAAPWWISRFERRGTAGVGFALSIGSVGACAVVSSYAGLLIALAIAGIGGGLLFTLAIVIISEQPNLERAFGFKLFAEVSAGVALLLILPTTIFNAWGFRGVALTVAATIGALAIVVLLGPPRAASRKATTSVAGGGSSLPSVTAGTALLALFVHVAVMTGFWSFLERVAGDFGLGTETASLIVVASMVANIAGALLAVAMGGKFGRAMPLTLSMLGQCAGLVALILVPNALGYVIGAMLANGLWSLILSYQYTVISDADDDRNGAALIPSAIALGAAVGPAFVGEVAERTGFNAVYAVVAASTLVSMSLFLGVSHRRTATPSLA